VLPIRVFYGAVISKSELFDNFYAIFAYCIPMVSDVLFRIIKFLEESVSVTKYVMKHQTYPQVC